MYEFYKKYLSINLADYENIGINLEILYVGSGNTLKPNGLPDTGGSSVGTAMGCPFGYLSQQSFFIV